ncbi:MAG: acyltransferase 3 [Actinomycetia bacterium]|nr:acyltransferase 3 [Actinomycetes bacterium]
MVTTATPPPPASPAPEPAPESEPHRSTRKARRAPHLGYQPALDGLRALAVIGVLLYHGGVDWMQGGFMGVDLFFTLSGFLITSLLLVEYRANSSIDLKRFWTRRARRLLPALLVLLVGVCFFAVFWADPATLPKLRSDGLAALFYYGNWHFIYQGTSYFDQFQAPSPLLHVWSLAIEEQWYVVWPLVLIPLLRWSKGKATKLLPIVLGLAGLSAWWMAYLVGPDPNRVYLGTDTRAQSLLMGAAVAIVITDWGTLRSALSRRLLDLAALGSLVGLFWLWYSTQQTRLGIYRGGFLLHSLLVAIVITSVVQPGRAIAKSALSVRVLRGIGKISYGLYLYHFPIFQVTNNARTGLSGAPLLVARLAVTTVVAVVSYYAIEMPIRKGAFRPWTMVVATPAVAGALVVALFLTTAGTAVANGGQLQSGSTVKIPPVTAPPADLEAGTFVPRTMVVGDSVARTLSESLFPLAGSLRLQGEDQSMIGCGLTEKANVIIGGIQLPLFGGCAGQYQRWTDDINRLKPDVTVALFGIWDEIDQQINGHWYRFGTAEDDAYLSGQLDRAIQIFSSQGGKVLLLTAPYTGRGEGVLTGRKWESNDPKVVQHMNALLRAAVARHQDVASIGDLNRFLAPDGVYRSTIGGKLWNSDGVHFNPYGGALASKWLAGQVHKVAVPPPPVVPSTPPKIYLVGDSVAYDMGLAFPLLQQKGLLIGNDGGRVGCGVERQGNINQGGVIYNVLQRCGDWEPRWRQTEAAEHPDYVVILSGAWEMSDRQLDGVWHRYPDPAIDAELRKSWGEAIDAAGSSGARVAVMTFPYVKVPELPDGSEPAENDPARVDHLNAIIRAVAKEKGASLLDLNRFLSPDHDRFETSLDGSVVRDADGVHFSDQGSVVTSTWMINQINRLRLLPRPTPSTTGAPTSTAVAAGTDKRTTTAAPTR